MLINPADVIVNCSTVYSNWGIRTGSSVTVTHLPTNTIVTLLGRSQHRARAEAFEALLEELKDAHIQLELF